jgi:chromosome partitioning protein
VAAHAVLVPVQCEFFALEGISQLKQTIDQIKGSLNPSLEIQGVVLTMHDARTSLPKEVASEVRAFFGAKVYETMIPRDFRVAEAPSHGKPIMVYDYDCPGSQAYIKLASEFLCGQCEPMDERHLMASTVTRARPPTTNGSVRGAPQQGRQV